MLRQAFRHPKRKRQTRRPDGARPVPQAEKNRRSVSKSKKSESRRPYGANGVVSSSTHHPQPTRLGYGICPPTKSLSTSWLVSREELLGTSDILHVTLPSIWQDGGDGWWWLASGVESAHGLGVSNRRRGPGPTVHLGEGALPHPSPLLLTGLHTQGGLFRKRGWTWGDWLWKTPQSLPTASFASVPWNSSSTPSAGRGGFEGFQRQARLSQSGEDIIVWPSSRVCFSPSGLSLVCTYGWVYVVVLGKQTTFSPSLVEADYETWGGGSKVDIS